MKLLEQIQSEFNFDCGDNSCRYASNKKGMRTNGGCRCFKDLHINKEIYVHRLEHAISKVEADLEAAMTDCKQADSHRQHLYDLCEAMLDALGIDQNTLPAPRSDSIVTACLKLTANLEAARKELVELTAKPKRVKPATPPRYDAVYFDGIAAMDEAEKGE